MAMTIYTFWARKLIEGTHTIKDVPPSFRDQVKAILKSQKYVVLRNGTVRKSK